MNEPRKVKANISVVAEFAWGVFPTMGVTVRRNSADPTVGPRNRLNFIEGNDIGITVADDLANGEVDITIESTATELSDLVELATRRYGGIIAGNIGASGNAASFNIFGTTMSFDGTAGTVIAADPSAAPTPGYNSGQGVFASHITTTANANVAGIRSTLPICQLRHRPIIKGIMRAGVNQAASIDNCRLWFGLFSTAPTTTDDPVGHLMGFRWSTAAGGAGDTAWRVLTKDNVTLRNVSSGVAHSVGRVIKFTIDASDPAAVEYYIDDVLVDTATTNLPASDTDLLLVSRAVNGNSGDQTTFRLSSLLWSSL